MRRKFTLLARNRKGTRRWSLVDSRGRHIKWITGEGKYEVQGRGAMVTKKLEDKHVLLACGSSTLEGRVRAFVNRRAIPANLRDNVDEYDAGRGASSLGGSRWPLRSPGFEWWEKFEGEDGLKRTYATYNAHQGGAMYLMINTTGVHGGGIVRAVFREGDPIVVLDDFPAGDTNGGGICRWRYVRCEGICGFVAGRP